MKRSMVTRDAPAAEVAIGAPLVRSLLADQHRDLADLTLAHVASGWDNDLFRLGDDLAVRLPRRGAAAVLIEHEQRWLPQLAAALPLPVPVPVRVGVPTRSYPWPWSITRWLPGEPAAARAPADPSEAAETLGRFLEALHRPAPSDAPRNPFRGGPLRERATPTEARLDHLGGELERAAIDRDRLRVCWRDLATTRAWPSPLVWLHGDLHPGNLLVSAERLSAVIDFGDITSGDPATDLAVAWMLFTPGDRARLRARAGDIDDDTWARARGWALALALAHLESSANLPRMASVAFRTLTAVLADEG
jgi:aminoglycoside phosphotransferase (APT) family kinase protein